MSIDPFPIESFIFMGDKSPRFMFRFMGNLVDVPLSVALNIK
jgi:hypothetical protein